MKRALLSGSPEVSEPEHKKDPALPQPERDIEPIAMPVSFDQSFSQGKGMEVVANPQLQDHNAPAIVGDRLRFLVTGKGSVDGRLVFKLKLQKMEVEDGTFDKQREFTTTTKCAWQYDEIAEGDMVKVLGSFNPESYECNLDDYQDDIYTGYIILEPDTYLTATLIASAAECPRRGSFELAFPKAEPRIYYPLLLGTMIHEMFDQCIVHQEDLVNLDSEIIEACLAEHYLELHLAGKTEQEARNDMKEYMTHISAIIQDNIVGKRQLDGTDYTITEVLALEHKMFSKRFAIKGQTDATVEVVQKSTGYTRVAAIELKSGEDRSQASHVTQAGLYALLLHELTCNVSDEQFLVYLKYARIKRVKVSKKDYADIIQNRNKLVRLQQLVNRGQLITPKMLKKSAACSYCPHSQFCYMYCKSYGKGTDIEDLPTIERLGPVAEIKDFVTPAVIDYFKKWNYMITLEQNSSERRAEQQGKKRFAESEVAEESKLAMTEIKRSGRETLIWLRKRGELELEVSTGSFVDIFCTESPLLTLGRGRILTRDFALDESKQRCTAISLSISDTTMLDILSKKMPLADLRNKTWSVRCSAQSNVVYAFMRWAVLGLCTNLQHQWIRGAIIEMKTPALPRMEYSLEQIVREYGDGPLKGLSAEQVHAILKSLNCSEYQLVMGVHSSGKSTTIAALLEILAQLGTRVFITANSHTALDSILRKLIPRGVKFLRVAPNKDAVHPDIQPYLTTYVAAQHDSTRAYIESMEKTRIFAATAFGVTTDLLRSLSFDCCVVDEASQMLEPVCVGALLCCKRFVLFGNGGQNSPMVGNAQARQGGFGLSLFDRLARAHPERLTKLCKQYVMNEGIMSLVNEVVYGGIMEFGLDKIRDQRLALPAHRTT